MRNNKIIEKMSNNNIEGKQENVLVGASIARPHFKEHTIADVEGILIAHKPQRNSLKYNQAGITLIALVITIIVLLILSAVTINLTLGERGIFSTAKRAGGKYKISEYLEKIELARIGVASENMGEVTLEKIIEAIYKDKVVPEGYITIIEDYALMKTPEGYNFKITKEDAEYVEERKEDLLQPVTSISIEPENVELKVGESKTITATINPSNAFNKTITWESGNPTIVTLGTPVVNTNGTTSIEITGVGEGNTVIIAKSNKGKDGETVVGTCTINVKQLLTSVVQIGDYVNYPVNIGHGPNEVAHKTDWRVFYKDETNVYLIASYFLLNSEMPSGTGMSGFSGYPYSTYWSSLPSSYTEITEEVRTNYKMSWDKGKSNPNIKGVSTLLNTNLWKKFAYNKANGNSKDLAEDAIGAPTLEMWIESWNVTGNIKLYCDNSNSNGYYVGTSSKPTSSNVTGLDMSNSLYFPVKTTDNAVIGIRNWLASPSASGSNYIMNISASSSITQDEMTFLHNSVRPLVRLRSDLSGTKDSNGVWQLQ